MFGNHVSITGNLTRDPELRFGVNGVAVATAGVAWNDRKREGQDEADVSFFNFVCFRELAENVAASLQKGDRVTIVGQLRQRRYKTDAGESRSVVEISANEVGPDLRWASASISKLGRTADRPETPAPIERDADEPF